MQIQYNRSPRRGKIQYIVIHDTGNGAKGADAWAHFQYFNKENRNSSADFFVDSKGVLQVNDYNAYYTWHCGDGYGKNGITNQNSIGVELCVNQDGNFEQTVKNAVGVVRRLMRKLHIPPTGVVRHFDASGKMCPKSMAADNWVAWKRFWDKIAMSDAAYLQYAVGLQDETVLYLQQYAYGTDLVQKLARAAEPAI